jgi:NADH dehydrogenase
MTTGERARGRSAFLTGGSGFVGRKVARRLLERGYSVRALARTPTAAACLRELGAEPVMGDVTQDAPLDAALAGCEAVVHLVGIIREQPRRVTFEEVHTRGTLRVVQAAQRRGVRRFVHMSALGARAEGTAYQRTKYEAEEVVRRSGLGYVIFRPSVIVGPDGDLLRTLLFLVRYLPATPIIGDGQYRLQPVDVEDVAAAMAQAVEREDLQGRCLEIGGPHKLTYNRILEILCEESGVRRPRVHVPLSLVRPLVALASNWRLPTPINSEQLTMLLEESVVPGESNVLREVFEIEPAPFRTVLQRLRELRRGGGA